MYANGFLLLGLKEVNVLIASCFCGQRHCNGGWVIVFAVLSSGSIHTESAMDYHVLDFEVEYQI